jgi:hypothetical protein
MTFTVFVILVAIMIVFPFAWIYYPTVKSKVTGREESYKIYRNGYNKYIIKRTRAMYGEIIYSRYPGEYNSLEDAEKQIENFKISKEKSKLAFVKEVL